MRKVPLLMAAGAAIGLLVAMIACSGMGGGGVVQSAAMFPQGKYAAFISIRPAQIYQSAVMKEWLKEVDEDELENFLEEFEKNVGIKIEQWDSFTAAFSMPNIDMMAGPSVDEAVFFFGAPLGEKDIERFFEDAIGNDEPEKETRENRTYWSAETGDGVFAISPVPGGLLGGMKDNVEDAIDTMAGKSKRLNDDADFQRAWSLIDPSASFSMMMWDLKKMIKPALENAAGLATEQDQKDAIEALEDLEAFGMSVKLDKDVLFTMKVRFAKASSAKEILDFYEKSVDKALDELPEDAELSPNPMIEFKKKDVEELFEEIKLAVEGDVLSLTMRLDDDSKMMELIRQSAAMGAMGAMGAPGGMMPEMPDMGGEMGSATPEQQQTLHNITMLSYTINNYIMANSTIGAPKANTIEELRTILTEAGYEVDDALLRDGWGNPLLYETDMQDGSNFYRLVSFGANGMPGPTPAQPGITGTPDEDIIFENGEFTQQPYDPNLYGQ